MMLVLVAVRVCLIALLLKLSGTRLLGQNAGWSAVLGKMREILWINLKYNES